MNVIGYVMLAISIVLMLVVTVLLVLVLKKKSSTPVNNNDSLILNDMNNQKNELMILIGRSNSENVGRIDMLINTINQLTTRFDNFMINVDAKLDSQKKDNSEAILKMRQETAQEDLSFRSKDLHHLGIRLPSRYEVCRRRRRRRRFRRLNDRKQ